MLAEKQERILLGVIVIALIFLFRKTFKNLAMEVVNQTWDVVSDRRINTLHPIIRQDARAFINAAAAEGIKLRVVSALRTFEEQQKIYNQGRVTPGRIVSNAKPGTSFHNYGLAIDVVEIKDGKALWENPRWNRIAEIGKSFGFFWGGDFRSFKDRPHFEKSFGFSTRELLAKRQGGLITPDGYVNVA